MFRLGRLCASLALPALVLLGAGAALAQPDPPPSADYVRELQARSRVDRLAENPQWRALLHYQESFLVHIDASEVDEPDFFLSARGHAEPQAELDATLAAFAAPATQQVRLNEHPQCAFVARYRWLRDALRFDPARLPEVPCPKFEAWRAAIRPVAVTLIFPEAYMNNPSSMFGHTLVRLDAEEAGQRRDLLAYATNFAADTGNDGAVLFAFKGIFGFYPGRFSLDPYYEKISQYGDWEQRDIWEYELDFSGAEIDRLLEHLWELRGVDFDYFFFDENCSYQVLALLEAARPSLQLRRRFPVWAIPADTVRALAADPKRVRRVTFRPSATTALRHEAAALEPAELDLALRVARGELAPESAGIRALPDRRRPGVLDVAHDYLRHSYLASEDVSREPALARARTILLARSRVPVEGPVAAPVDTPGVRPDQGHGTARLGVSGGIRRQRAFTDVVVRPAFHDLLDPVGGYTGGAQIDFLDARLRVYPDRGEFRLQNLALIDIVSLTPRDRLFQPWSWKINTNVRSQVLPRRHGHSGLDGLDDRYVWRTNGGAGVAYLLGSQLTGYGFLGATGDIGAALRDGHAIGPQAEVGVFASAFDDRGKLRLFAEATEFALGERRTAAHFGLAARWSLHPSLALRLEITETREFDKFWPEAALGVNWYL